MNTLSVVEEIMRETRTPMSVRQIVEHSAGRLPTRARMPDTVVARDLSMDIIKKGAASIFVRTAVGRYTLRELCREHEPATPEQAASTPARSRQAQTAQESQKAQKAEKAQRRARSPEGATHAMPS